MMIRAHAAMSAKGRLEPFQYDAGPIGPQQADADRALEHTRSGKARFRVVLVA